MLFSPRFRALPTLIQCLEYIISAEEIILRSQGVKEFWLRRVALLPYNKFLNL